MSCMGVDCIYFVGTLSLFLLVQTHLSLS